MSNRRWWKSKEERGKSSRFVTQDMLTRDERDNHEGARINRWLRLADQMLGNTDDDDPGAVGCLGAGSIQKDLISIRS